MKPGINPIPDFNVHVIKHRLTQPQEVDLILMAIAAQDLALSHPTAEGAQLIETQRNTDAIAGECDQVCCRWRQDCFDTANVGELSGI
jgi:hypothetical protein